MKLFKRKEETALAVKENPIVVSVPDIKEYLVREYNRVNSLVSEKEMLEEELKIAEEIKLKYEATLVTLDEYAKRLKNAESKIETEKSNAERIKNQLNETRDELNSYQPRKEPKQMRDRLIELLKETRCERECDGFKNAETCKGCTAYERYTENADYLLANGVIVPKLDIGDKIKVWAKTIPTHEIDIEEEKIPEFLDGEVVSVRKNKKGWFFKFKIYARWTKDVFEWELGNYTESYMGVRYFSYPMSAIGKTVFLSPEEAEAKLKEGGKE